MSLRDVLEARLRNDPDVMQQLAFLDAADVTRCISNLDAKRNAARAANRHLLSGGMRDISARSPSEVRIILRSFKSSPATVTVIWVPDKMGVKLEYGTFIAHFDDFWYPSSDDVWVTDDAASFLIELDHEEWLSFFEFI